MVHLFHYITFVYISGITHVEVTRQVSCMCFSSGSKLETESLIKCIVSKMYTTLLQLYKLHPQQLTEKLPVQESYVTFGKTKLTLV